MVELSDELFDTLDKLRMDSLGVYASLLSCLCRKRLLDF